VWNARGARLMLGAGSALAAPWDALALGIGAIGFESRAFERVAAAPGAWELALVVAYLAGVSQAIGHGVVLFLNRVPPGRFALSLALMGAIYLAGALATAASALAIADLAFGMNLAFLPTISVIALAHAPRLLGFATLAPYFGELFDRLLDVWVLLLVLYGLHAGLGVPVHGATMLALIGWGSMRLLALVLGRPLTTLVGAAERAAAGGPLSLNAGNIVDALRDKARNPADRRDGER
jgi:hypothetical protein